MKTSIIIKYLTESLTEFGDLDVYSGDEQPVVDVWCGDNKLILCTDNFIKANPVITLDEPVLQ